MAAARQRRKKKRGAQEGKGGRRWRLGQRMRTALSMRRWRARKASEEGHGGARRRAFALTGNRGKEKGGEVGGKLDGEAVRRSARAQRAEVPGDSAAGHGGGGGRRGPPPRLDSARAGGVRGASRGHGGVSPAPTATVGCEVGRPREAAMGATVRRRRGKREEERRGGRGQGQNSLFI